MKNILIIISAAIVLYSCSTKGEMHTKPNNDNYVVILDLSDRLIQNPDQVNIDTSVIRAVFEKFENSVQRNLVIKSKDIFSIRIIPQRGSSLPVNTFENSLTLDMGKYSAAEKLKQLLKFKTNLSGQLALLYQQAYLGNKNSDFSGVDIWQYFNEQVNSDLDSRYNNKVIVITDGYFDFEDKQHGISSNNRSTTTAPLLNKMNGTEWQKHSDDNEIGLIPIKINVAAQWLVCCIQPKVGNRDLLETQKLSYLWKKWLLQSGAKTFNGPIMNSSSVKIKSLVINSL